MLLLSLEGFSARNATWPLPAWLRGDRSSRCRMHETFGARLRRRREEQAIALVTIANQTKIKASLFDELERDNVSHWPSGLFRRAYIRAYATAIGLDPEPVVREFLTVHPDPAEIVEAP